MASCNKCVNELVSDMWEAGMDAEGEGRELRKLIGDVKRDIAEEKNNNPRVQQAIREQLIAENELAALRVAQEAADHDVALALARRQENEGSGIHQRRKSRGRMSRGRKSRGRKSRGRKSRGRKSRGRKSRGRKSRGRKSH